jgi:hypothetical protein
VVVASGPEDLSPDDRDAWRQRFEDPAKDTPERPAHPEQIYSIRYLGLWDTVGSMGVPKRFAWLPGTNDQYRFYDTSASSLITGLRHAVAVDEDRAVFDDTPVDNIQDLNLEWAKAQRPMEDLAQVPYDARPYQQKWFPGDHGAVGGGNPELGLSSSALRWIAAGARDRGLALYWAADGELAEADRLAQPLAEWRIRADGSRRAAWEFDLLGAVGGFLDRSGPKTPDEAHESTRRRINGDSTYRPLTLDRIVRPSSPAPVHRRVGTAVAVGAAGLALSAVSLGVVAAGRVLRRRFGRLSSRANPVQTEPSERGLL